MKSYDEDEHTIPDRSIQLPVILVLLLTTEAGKALVEDNHDVLHFSKILFECKWYME